MTFRHKTSAPFWDLYAKLPADLRRRADKQFELLLANPGHPSLQLKPVGVLWSARITGGYRALALREGSVFTWFWIGTHEEYERLLQS